MGAAFRNAKAIAAPVVKDDTALKATFRKTVMESIKSTPVYSFAVDTAANLTFNLPICVVSQLKIAHMTPVQSMKANVLTTASLLLTGRLYGKFRDFAYEITRTTASSQPIKKIAVDTVASNVFGMPLYALQLWLSGANPEQIRINVGAGLLISVPAGRLFGMWMDGARRISGLPPASKLAESARK